MNIIKNLGVSITLLLLPMIGFATSSANVQISKTELESQINKGNILSDSFGSGNECITTKDKYNQEYSSYKRSECFLNDGKYYYFICQLSNSCVINIIPTTSTANQTVGTTTQDIPNKAKLDAFLSKVSQMRKELNNDTKYGKVLSQVEAQLKTLGEKYKVSSTVTQMVGYLGVGIQNIKSELSQTQYVDDFFCELLGNCGGQVAFENNSSNKNTDSNESTNSNSTNINNTTTNNNSSNNTVSNDEYINLISKEETQKLYTHILDLVKNPPSSLEWRTHEGKQVATYFETIYQRKSTNPIQYRNFIDFYITYQDKGGKITADTVSIRYAQTPTNNPSIGKMKIFIPKDTPVAMCIGACSVVFQSPAAYDTVLWAFGNTPSYTFGVGDDGHNQSVSYIPSMDYGASYEYGKTFRSINGYDWKNVVYNPPSITPGWFVADKSDWLYQDYVYATKVKIPNHPAFQSVSSGDNSSYPKALEIALKDTPNMNYSIDRGEQADSTDANGNPIRMAPSRLLDSSYKGIQTTIQLLDKVDPKTNKKTDITLIEQLESIIKSFESGNTNTNSQENMNISNPTLTVDKTSAKEGETLTFTWNANSSGVEYCKYYINGNTDNTKLSGMSGKIPVANVPAGNYALQLECKYNSGETKKTSLVTISITSNTTTNNNSSNNTLTNEEYVSLITKEKTQEMYTHILNLMKNPPSTLVWRTSEGKQVSSHQEKIYERKSANQNEYKNYIDFSISYEEKAGKVNVTNLQIRYVQTSLGNNSVGKTKIFLPKGVGAGMHIGGTFGGGRTAYDSVLWAFGATPSYNFKTGDDGYPYSTSHIPSIMYGASYEYGKTYRSINGYDYKNIIYNPQIVDVGNFTSNTNDWLYFDFVYATKYKIPDHPAFTQYTGRDGYHTAVEIALKDNPNINYSIDSGDTIATLDKSRKGIVTFISLYNTKETTILQQLESIVKNF